MNDLLRAGLTVIVITEGPYKDKEGKLIKRMVGRDKDNIMWKVKFFTDRGSSMDIYFRWLPEADLLPANDVGISLLFRD